jgi:hypothetical protein
MTGNKCYLQRQTATHSHFQKNEYNTNIRIFNNLPTCLKILKNEKAQFKVAVDTFYLQKLALTWPTSCGRSVGMVRSQTTATKLLLL